MKLGAKRVPMEEGMCHRTERLMEYIYDDDPFYPLAVTYRRHHTSVRIKADLYMQYFGRPLEDAIKLYMDELGFDYQTAKGQAVSQLPQKDVYKRQGYGSPISFHKRLRSPSAIGLLHVFPEQTMSIASGAG